MKRGRRWNDDSSRTGSMPPRHLLVLEADVFECQNCGHELNEGSKGDGGCLRESIGFNDKNPLTGLS